MARSHAIVAGSDRRPVAGATATGKPDPNEEIEVTLKVRRKNKLPDLRGRPSKQITRQQLAARYGASNADIAKVKKTLGRYHLKVVKSDAATRTVRLRGKIADMEKAFDVKLFNYLRADEGYQGGAGPVRAPEDYRGRVGPVHIPVELKKSSKRSSVSTTAAWSTGGVRLRNLAPPVPAP